MRSCFGTEVDRRRLGGEATLKMRLAVSVCHAVRGRMVGILGDLWGWLN